MPQQPESTSVTSPQASAKVCLLGPVPTRAFCWQWPCRRISGNSCGEVEAQCAFVGLPGNELFKRKRVGGDHLVARIARQQCFRSRRGNVSKQLGSKPTIAMPCCANGKSFFHTVADRGTGRFDQALGKSSGGHSSRGQEG